MQRIAGEGLRKWLQHFTGHVFKAILAGTVATILLDSSSLVIVIIIALVSAEILPLKNALGMTLGANIGTTVGSQIMALNVNEWAAVPLLMGLALFLLSKRYYMKYSGYSLLGLGLLFYGMMAMDEAVYPLRHHEPFLNWLESLNNPFIGVGVGGLLTFIIQSSSATVAIAITMVSAKLLTFKSAVAVMMGAEIGTCTDTLIASIGC